MSRYYSLNRISAREIISECKDSELVSKIELICEEIINKKMIASAEKRLQELRSNHDTKPITNLDERV